MPYSLWNELVHSVSFQVTLWPISPLKKPPKEGPQFAELAFSEDSSDDEDYKPDQDDLNVKCLISFLDFVVVLSAT